MQVTVTRPLTHKGIMRKVGDAIEVTPQLARILKASGRVSYEGDAAGSAPALRPGLAATTAIRSPLIPPSAAPVRAAPAPMTTASAPGLAPGVPAAAPDGTGATDAAPADIVPGATTVAGGSIEGKAMVPNSEDRVATLRTEAAALGVSVDRRWGEARLETEIENAKKAAGYARRDMRPEK
jgi:hypothetical protein